MASTKVRTRTSVRPARVEVEELHFWIKNSGNAVKFGSAPPPVCFLPSGVAAAQTPGVVYGVVDLYGMAVKVTIVHNHNHSDRLRRNNAIMRALSPDVGRPRPSLSLTPDPEGPDRLLFHTNCGQKAAIISDGRTALRPQ